MTAGPRAQQTAVALSGPAVCAAVLLLRGWSVFPVMVVTLLFSLLWLAARTLRAVRARFGVAVAGRVATDFFRVPSLMRRAGMTVGGCVWVRIRPNGVRYLIPAAGSLSSQRRADLEARIRESLRARSVSWGPAWVPGWGWVDVGYVDPFSNGTRAPRPNRGGHHWISVGRTADGTVARVPLEAGGHVALQGATGSGKSSLARLLIRGALDAGMEVRGSDLSGLLLGDLRGADVALGTDSAEAHVSVVERAVAHLDGVLAGRRVESRAGGGAGDLQPVLFVLEELPGLLAFLRNDDRLQGRRPVDRLAARLEAAVGRLCAEGRKAGIVVVAIAQRFDADLLGGPVRNNFAVRISLRGEPAGVSMLHPNCPLDIAREQSALRPGVGLLEAPTVPLVQFAVDETGGAVSS